jgi:hypothetical protein
VSAVADPLTRSEATQRDAETVRGRDLVSDVPDSRAATCLVTDRTMLTFC